MAKDGEDAPPKRSLFGFLRGGSEKKKEFVESEFTRLRSLQQARREEASDADRRAHIEATADRQGRIDHLVERFRERALEVLEVETKQQGDAGRCDIDVPIDEDLLVHTFTHVAMGDEQGRLHIVDALNGDLLHDMPLHRNWCTALSSSRDGALVATGSLDRTVKVVSSESGELLGDLRSTNRSLPSPSRRRVSNWPLGRRLVACSSTTCSTETCCSNRSRRSA